MHYFHNTLLLLKCIFSRNILILSFCQTFFTLYKKMLQTPNKFFIKKHPFFVYIFLFYFSLLFQSDLVYKIPYFFRLSFSVLLFFSVMVYLIQSSPAFLSGLQESFFIFPVLGDAIYSNTFFIFQSF